MNGQWARRVRGESRRLAALALLVGLGLALRLGAVGALHTAEFVTFAGRPASYWGNRLLFPDSAEFLGMAHNILHGRGFMVSPTSRIGRMPGYPVFLALVQLVCGDSLVAYRVADAVVGAGVVALVWVLAQVLFSAREGLVAGLIAAMYPAFVLYVVVLLSETLFMALLVGGSVCVALAYRREELRWPALGGLLLGLATLARAGHSLCVPLLAVVWVGLRRFERRTLVKAGVLVAVFVGSLVPWVVRNWWASGGHLVVTTLRTGPSLYEGLNPKATGGPMMDRIKWNVGTEGMTEWAQDRHWRRAALEFARENPWRVVCLAGAKLVRFWRVVPSLAQLRRPLLAVALGVPYAVVMALAAVGLVVSRRRGDVGLIVVLPVVYYSLLHMVFVGSMRYRLAVMPLLVVAAAHGAVEVWSRWLGGRSDPDRDRASLQRGGDGRPAVGAGAGGASGEAGAGG